MTKSSIKESNNILLNQTNSLDKKKMNEKKNQRKSVLLWMWSKVPFKRVLQNLTTIHHTSSARYIQWMHRYYERIKRLEFKMSYVKKKKSKEMKR